LTALDGWVSSSGKVTGLLSVVEMHAVRNGRGRGNRFPEGARLCSIAWSERQTPGIMPKTMRIDTRRRGAGLALGVAVAAVVLLSVVVGLTTPVPPGPTPPGSDVAAATFVNGPIVYSEILDADGSWLIERRLDGQRPPRPAPARSERAYGPP